MRKRHFEYVPVLQAVFGTFGSGPLVPVGEWLTIVAGNEPPVVDVKHVREIRTRVRHAFIPDRIQSGDWPDTQPDLIRGAAATAHTTLAGWSHGTLAGSLELLTGQIEENKGGVIDSVDDPRVVLCQPLGVLTPCNDFCGCDVREGVAVEVISVVCHLPSLADAVELNGERTARGV